MKRCYPLLSVFLLSACGGSEPDRELLVSWTENQILPRYADLVTRTEALHTAAQFLCATRDASTLQAAQDAWRAARKPWKEAEVVRFGPYKEFPLRLGPKMDFWPARIPQLDEILTSSDAIDANTLGASQEGFPASEYILFPLAVEFLDDPGIDRRCDYLTLLTNKLIARAVAMQEAWLPESGNYQSEFVDAGISSEAFETVNLAVSEIVNRMAFTAENAVRDKLGKPFGVETGSPPPERAESPYAERTIEDLQDNLRGIEAFYFDGPDYVGLETYAGPYNEEMRSRLDAAQAAVSSINEPFADAVFDQQQEIEAAMDRLTELQAWVQVDIIEGLELTPKFNDTDGD